jgi:hypothetical protein
LTADIIWIVAYHAELAVRINDIEIEFEEVALDKM